MGSCDVVQKESQQLIMYGLIGKKLTHSFSKRYFTEKFQREGINSQYDLFELAEIRVFPDLLRKYPALRGLNVTIPYKSDVIAFLDGLSPEAEAVGAVNTIKFDGGRHIGYNTDVIGFRVSLEEVLEGKKLKKALVLGSGGASKAVVYTLRAYFGCESQLVSRRASKNILSYEQLAQMDLGSYDIVVNTTPLGTYPNEHTSPNLCYEQFRQGQIAFDLVYNPEETLFLKHAKAHLATPTNGMGMLVEQAEASWQIWEA